MPDFRELILETSRNDLPLPCGKGREAETEREVREGLPILRAALLPDPPRRNPRSPHDHSCDAGHRATDFLA